jgi:hypothetical protein
MAARLNRHHSEEIRQKIQASNIIHRLQQHIDGEVEMSPTQISAAQTLLDRSVPKLSQIQHIGDPENPLDINHTVQFVGAHPATTET